MISFSVAIGALTAYISSFFRKKYIAQIIILGSVMIALFAFSLFSGYNAAKLVKDILAGLTVCAVALPLALAFGVSSGASVSGVGCAAAAAVGCAVAAGASTKPRPRRYILPWWK